MFKLFIQLSITFQLTLYHLEELATVEWEHIMGNIHLTPSHIRKLTSIKTNQWNFFIRKWIILLLPIILNNLLIFYFSIEYTIHFIYKGHNSEFSLYRYSRLIFYLDYSLLRWSLYLDYLLFRIFSFLTISSTSQSLDQRNLSTSDDMS